VVNLKQIEILPGHFIECLPFSKDQNGKATEPAIVSQVELESKKSQPFLIQSGHSFQSLEEKKKIESTAQSSFEITHPVAIKANNAQNNANSQIQITPYVYKSTKSSWLQAVLESSKLIEFNSRG
jgi:hypothetical protein